MLCAGAYQVYEKRELTSAELIGPALRGERWAEEEIVRLIRLISRHVCEWRRTPEYPELHWEDVAQEASKAFFGKRERRFQPGGSERGYLNTMVRTTRLQLLRTMARRRRREQIGLDEDPPRGPVPEVRLDAEKILVRLDEACRHLLER